MPLVRRPSGGILPKVVIRMGGTPTSAKNSMSFRRARTASKCKSQQIGLNMSDKLFWQDYKKATNPCPIGPKD
jgi:hypothetical protein